MRSKPLAKLLLVLAGLLALAAPAATAAKMLVLTCEKCTELRRGALACGCRLPRKASAPC
jgi:hypothetical protein